MKAAPPPTKFAAVGVQPKTGVASHVVQRASITTTGVTASGKGKSKTGTSGSGPTVGSLLRGASSTAAAEFLAILTWINGQGHGRSAFTCAEPHAVAQLLASDSTITLGDITVHTAHDGRGLKDTCPVCSEWIYNGKIADPRPSASSSSSAPSTFNLMDFLVTKKKKPKKAKAPTPLDTDEKKGGGE